MAQELEETLIEADMRGRIALAKLAGSHRHFLGSVLDDGSILLRPAVVRSVVEDRLLTDPKIAQSVRTGLASNERVKSRPRRRGAAKT